MAAGGGSAESRCTSSGAELAGDTPRTLSQRFLLSTTSCTVCSSHEPQCRRPATGRGSWGGRQRQSAWPGLDAGHGDAGAMEELVRRMMPLAHRVARRYHRSSEPIDDLEQAANCGLLGALQRFDPHRGTELLSYAAASIDGELKRYHRDHCWSTRVPRRGKERALSIHRKHERLGADPVPGRASGTAGQVFTQSTARRRVGARRALELFVKASQAQKLRYPPEIEEAGYQRVEDADEFTHLLKLLPVGERRVVSLRFRHGLSQREIADRVRNSQMQGSWVLRTGARASRCRCRVLSAGTAPGRGRRRAAETIEGDLRRWATG